MLKCYSDVLYVLQWHSVTVRGGMCFSRTVLQGGMHVLQWDSVTGGDACVTVLQCYSGWMHVLQ